jgi:pyroglutamyl-peptidase
MGQIKVLLTGFEPFGGEQINPAYEAIKGIEDNIGNIHVIKAEVPTVFGKCIEMLDELIDRENPDVVICVGQAGGRFDITIERVAINVDDAHILDNAGNQPIDQPVFADGENAYFSTLPIKVIVSALKQANIPASISDSAGTFVCNHLMYGLQYLIRKKYPKVRGGFIHVPFTTVQVINKVQMPYMELSRITEALSLAVKVVADN